MKHFKFYLILLFSLIFGVASMSSSISANKSELIDELNSYAQSNEKADFCKVEMQNGKLVVHIDDDYVESVDEFGLESYLQDTYRQVNKYQKKNGTKLSIVFKDKASGTFAKSSNSGRGWYKSSDGKADFNFKTGEAE